MRLTIDSAKQGRPRLEVPPTPLDRILGVLAHAGALALVAVVAFGYRLLPDRVPLHFDLRGEPDRWGAPGELAFVPIMGLALYGLLTFVARVPHAYNYPWEITERNAARQYRLARRLVLALRATLVWTFVAILVGTGGVATGAIAALGPWPVVAALAASFGSVVAYFLVASGEP